MSKPVNAIQTSPSFIDENVPVGTARADPSSTRGTSFAPVQTVPDASHAKFRNGLKLVYPVCLPGLPRSVRRIAAHPSDIPAPEQRIPHVVTSSERLLCTYTLAHTMGGEQHPVPSRSGLGET